MNLVTFRIKDNVERFYVIYTSSNENRMNWMYFFVNDYVFI